ncbi:hypothetical protein [Microbulbifer epialgicus]|uniref:Uncharacterized protein n=1 Tax=Microbulbifer epialgicus TaxID=393907 RepID=A0ABV4P600_9GAMM
MCKYLHEKMVSTLTKYEVKEDASLWEYPLFTYTLYIGIIATLASIVVISILLGVQTGGENARYESCMSMTCINNIFIYFAPAIKIGAGFLAILGIIALIFRSEQTATQISNSNKSLQYDIARNSKLWEHEQLKTAFSQYFQHKETFLKLMERIESQLGISFLDKTSLYRDWFPFCSVKKFDIEPPPT